MKTVIQTLSLSAVLISLAMTGSNAVAEGNSAKDPTDAPRVDKRIENQKKRISHKLEKGKITSEEANNLNQKVDAVQSKEQELKKDGKLTKEERKELHQELNKNSQEIKATGQKSPTPSNR